MQNRAHRCRAGSEMETNHYEHGVYLQHHTLRISTNCCINHLCCLLTFSWFRVSFQSVLSRACFLSYVFVASVITASPVIRLAIKFSLCNISAFILVLCNNLFYLGELTNINCNLTIRTKQLKASWDKSIREQIIIYIINELYLQFF